MILAKSSIRTKVTDVHGTCSLSLASGSGVELTWLPRSLREYCQLLIGKKKTEERTLLLRQFP